VECCSKPLLKWIADNLGLEVVINIMPQYRPAYNASKHQDISVFPSKNEIKEINAYAKGLGFVNLI
jgi:putative pyruvate formate lyase activating enzyme